MFTDGETETINGRHGGTSKGDLDGGEVRAS